MILFLDCASGVSGDMLVAALADLAAKRGVDAPAELQKALRAVGIDEGLATVRPVRRGGLAALAFEVDESPGFASLADLQAAVRASALPPRVAKRVSAVAARMAEAERRVHGGGEPRLHELASVDTAADVVAAVTLAERLAARRVVASPPALGGGTVRTAHGVLPVPAPAVLELLNGLPTRGGDADAGELTTPTGAALLAELVDEWGPLPAGAIGGVGVGAGSRELPGAPNVLRAVAVEEGSVADPHGGAVELLETTIDDASAELLAYAADKLRQAGALDVWFTPALMKKGRPGQVVHALVRAPDRSALAAMLLRETTTFGLRVLPVQRVVADERREVVMVAGGQVHVRLGYLAGLLVTASPEFEDCRRLAEQAGLPLKKVYAAAQAAAFDRFGAA
jgi:uncharacterized protein (TIGR00299 family) protein